MVRSVSLVNSTLQHNSASQHGAGLGVSDGASATLTDCTLVENGVPSCAAAASPQVRPLCALRRVAVEVVAQWCRATVAVVLTVPGRHGCWRGCLSCLCCRRGSMAAHCCITACFSIDF